MKILVFQHEEIEHPGVFRRYFAQDGHEWNAVQLGSGEPVPSLDGWDALWVMGGPMDVWQEDVHPWLVPEKAAIRDAVIDRGLPFFGICLGHQLLAEVLGGQVGRAAVPEVGLTRVDLDEGADGFAADLPPALDVMQWHGAEVSRMPVGAKNLGRSRDCSVQAMSWGARAFSVQFHPEIEADTLPSWTSLPEYRLALDSVLGPGATDRVVTDCATNLQQMNANAQRMYENWLAAARV